jgi:hypothetical protein
MNRNEINIDEVLNEPYVVRDGAFDGKWTKTTQFLNPLIDLNLRNRIIMNYFVNMFLDDHAVEHNYVRPIFVLFRTKDFQDVMWLKVYGAMKASAHYRYDYDVGVQDGYNLIMIVFSIPESSADDYYHFKKGHYSKFSDSLKSKFPRFLQNPTTGEPEESIIWGVMHKSRHLKKLLEEEFDTPHGHFDDAPEIWDQPQKDREYYRYQEASQ